MNLDRVAAVSRALDAAIRWLNTPRWRKGTLRNTVSRAYHRCQIDGGVRAW